MYSTIEEKVNKTTTASSAQVCSCFFRHPSKKKIAQYSPSKKLGETDRQHVNPGIDYCRSGFLSFYPNYFDHRPNNCALVHKTTRRYK